MILDILRQKHRFLPVLLSSEYKWNGTERNGNELICIWQNLTPPLGAPSPAMPQEAPHPLSTEGSGEVFSDIRHSADPCAPPKPVLSRLSKACYVVSRLMPKIKQSVAPTLTCIGVPGLPIQRPFSRGLRKQNYSFAIPKAWMATYHSVDK